jgi:hypothetical protein
VRAARSPDPVTAAYRYAALGFSVLPLRGKRPLLCAWKAYQTAPPSRSTLHRWASAGLFQNVGIVCGAASGGPVVLDLDGEAAYAAFAARFPHLAATYTVRTGSGEGHHVYLLSGRVPPSTRALGTPYGNLELLSTGRQVVAPPSVHPDTGARYTVARVDDIRRVRDLDDLVAWIRDLKRRAAASTRTVRHPEKGDHRRPGPPAPPDPLLVDALAAHFRRAGYRRRGPWLNGPCIYPGRHAHDDRHHSFGFNTQTGRGYCFRCGSIPAGDIAAAIGLDPCRPAAAVRTSYTRKEK